MVERTGINLPVVDLGWPPLSAITWGSPIAPFVIPLTILINVAMLALNKTRTVDVDMWNYWHFALAGTLVYYSSGSLFFGLLAAAIAAVVVLKLADWSAPLVQNTLAGRDLFADALFGGVLSGRSVGRQNHRPYPRPQSYSYRSGNRTEKFGIFGEPMMVGTILGIFLGVIAGYDFKSIAAWHQHWRCDVHPATHGSHSDGRFITAV